MSQHIPLRRCVGCFEMKPKATLLRVVRLNSAQGNPFVWDATGKAPGRGAYCCPNEQCFAQARKKRGLERSFRQSVPSDVYEQLVLPS